MNSQNISPSERNDHNQLFLESFCNQNRPLDTYETCDSKPISQKLKIVFERRRRKNLRALFDL